MTVSKNQRQRMIADWLRSDRVGSQDDVVARLALAGLAATQATVSRDLDELGAVKVRREGAIRYVITDAAEPGQAAARLDRLLAEWVDAIIPAGNLLVVRTPPWVGQPRCQCARCCANIRHRRHDRGRRHDFRRARRGGRCASRCGAIAGARNGTEPRRD